MSLSRLTFSISALMLIAMLAHADSSTTDEIAKYRALLADGNPAELWEMRGEELWQTKAGPKAATLQQCDLGKGPANYVPLSPLGFMERAAAVYPNRLAVVHGDIKRTWKDTRDRAVRLASGIVSSSTVTAWLRCCCLAAR